MKRLFVIAALWILAATPVNAGPLVTAISAIGSALAASTVLRTVVQLAVSVAISAYQQRRVQKQAAAAQSGQSGLTTEYTTEGGTAPLSVIVGTYATAGHIETPPMSWPANSSPANVYLTYVIGLGDVAGIKPTGRVAINDKWCDYTAMVQPLRGLGITVEGALNGLCWFRFRDGSETNADALLLDSLGGDDQRPWLADMIGRGIPHVIATFMRDQQAFPSDPKLRFEVTGIPLYDPRQDSSVGGDGAQRWADKSTWAFSDNPKVIEYNIHRGLHIDGYGVWGNSVAAADLPLDNWFAAMNACDVLVSDGASGSEKSYVFGFEWALDATPASIIDEINRSCAGETVEIGGVYKTRVGGVGLPVYFFTDDDIIVTRAQDLEPFVGLDQTFNALSCTFPDPRLIWESREAPPFTNDVWEAEDGQLEYDEDLGGFARRPRRLLKQMSLPGVSNHRQVQRLMASAANEGRKRRSHALTLPPDALKLEPLDAVSWTSVHNGFADKVFDVVMTIDPVTELRPRIGILEADPNDYTVPSYQSYDAPAAGAGGTQPLSPPGVPTAQERLYSTRAGAGLKVALRLVSAPSPSPDARGYQWQQFKDGAWRDLVRSATSDIDMLDVALGAWQVRVRAEGALGAVSDWAYQDFEVSGLAAPPVAVLDATLQSAGGLALITWSPHPDLDVQEGGAIVVRHSSHPAPAWENTTAEWRCFGRNTSIIVPLMPGAYFVRAEDATQIGGPDIMLRTDGVQATPFIASAALQEDDEFAGTHAGTRVDVGALYLTSALLFDDVIDDAVDALDWDYAGGVQLDGVYSFAAALDFGTAKRVRLRALIVQEPIAVLDDFDSTAGDVDDSIDWDGTSGAECAVVMDIQTTQSDPATAADWSDWTSIQSSEVTARGVRARARLSSKSPAFTPKVSQLRLIADEVSP